MAKFSDYEIVTALQIHPKAAPWKFEIEFCVLKCSQGLSSARIYATELSTKCCFVTILFMWALL